MYCSLCSFVPAPWWCRPQVLLYAPAEGRTTHPRGDSHVLRSTWVGDSEATVRNLPAQLGRHVVPGDPHARLDAYAPALRCLIERKSSWHPAEHAGDGVGHDLQAYMRATLADPPAGLQLPRELTILRELTVLCS